MSMWVMHVQNVEKYESEQVFVWVCTKMWICIEDISLFSNLIEMYYYFTIQSVHSIVNDEGNVDGFSNLKKKNTHLFNQQSFPSKSCHDTHIFHVDISSMSNQQFHNFCVSIEGCPMKRCLKVINKCDRCDVGVIPNAIIQTIKNQMSFQKGFISKESQKPTYRSLQNECISHHHITSPISFHFLFSHTLTSQIFPIFKSKCLVHLHPSKIIHPKSVITTPTSTHKLSCKINNSTKFKQQTTVNIKIITKHQLKVSNRMSTIPNILTFWSNGIQMRNCQIEETIPPKFTFQFVIEHTPQNNKGMHKCCSNMRMQKHIIYKTMIRMETKT